jgi:DtxR family Mn-dependent transcriptional regulator
MKRERPTPTVEDYLGVIYTLERDQVAVISARLAQWMEVSAPTVTATVKRMVRDGWVTMDNRREIHLTAQGREAAQSVMRRHMLSELLLARMLGVPWSRVHQEADAMEHTLSRETMERIQEQLDDPKTCPHGNPLPGYEPLLDEWTPLVEVASGNTVTIRRVHESAEESPELLTFLEANNLMPGTVVTVEEIAPYNQTITVLVGEQQVVLGLGVTEQIYVQTD